MRSQLFSDKDYKKRAQLILKNYDDVRLDIEKFNDQLIVLLNKLDDTRSFPDFHKVVQEIIDTETALDQFFLHSMKGINKNVKDALIGDLKGQDKFLPFTNTLIFNQIITDRILVNKERLSIERIETELPAEKAKAAKDFIKSIAVLKPITDLMENQRADIKAQLAAADTSEKVADIENQVDAQDKDFLKAYQTLIQFPEDEETAGAIIKFLETNQHIQDIMRSFDFAESLMDDVLDARAKAFSMETPKPS